MLNMSRWCGVLILLAATTIASAKLGGIGADNSFTEHDYRKALLEYNRRTLGEAYKQIGQRDAKWDNAAIKFLDGMALHLSNNGASPLYRIKGQLSDDQLLSLGKEARDKGCNDPLINLA